VGEDPLTPAALSTSKWDPAEYARVGAFVAELGQAALDLLDPKTGERILDVGCGEGSLLAALAASVPSDATGVDLSQPAIELAARRHPELGWVIANADRFLPCADGSADVVLVVSAHAAPRELRRVLAPGGRLVVVTPAADDLIELRAAVLGEGQQRPRIERLLGELAPLFGVEEQATVRHVAELDAAVARDALAASYRGARRSQQERLTGLGPMRVTMSFDLARLR